MIEKKDLLPDQQAHLLDDFIPDEQDLSEEAKQLFPYHTDILRTFELHRSTALRNDHITPIGRHLFFTDMAEKVRTYQSVLNYIASNQHIRQSPRITRPIIIIGLPRTGSTLLFNLLACDTNSRAPYFTDMVTNCLPPIPRSDITHRTERVLELKAILEYKEKLLGRTCSTAVCHPVYLIEEDYFILRHVGYSMLFFIHSFDHPCESEKWLFDETKKGFLYEYHEIFLRMLNSVDSPGSHWIFKAPFHSLFLDELIQHYADARLIMTHRCLEDIIPSLCRLLWTAMSIYFDKNDADARKAVNGFGSRFVYQMAERIVKFRADSSSPVSKEIVDVAYEDLMKYPIETVRKIYESFNLPYSKEFEVAMQQWLHDNPQGKQGRHTYHLSDVNLTSDDIQQCYANYIDRFRSYLSERTSP